MITALALSPDDETLACHGYQAYLDNTLSKVGYLFLLRADTGMTVSKLMQITHNENYTVHSAGFLVDNSKKVMMAFNHALGYMNGSSIDQRFKVAAWDGKTNSMIYNLESVGFRGFSGALTNGSGAQKYAGGSFVEDGQSEWDWAILKIESPTSTSPIFTLSRVQYYLENGCTGTNCGLSEPKDSPMISHMGLHEESGQTPKMFGLTNSHNKDGD